MSAHGDDEEAVGLTLDDDIGPEQRSFLARAEFVVPLITGNETVDATLVEERTVEEKFFRGMFIHVADAPPQYASGHVGSAHDTERLSDACA